MDFVLRVLMSSKLFVLELERSNDGVLILIEKDDGSVSEIVELPKMVGRRMLQRFKRKFGIPIHRFYHTEDSSEEKRAG